MSLPTRFGGYLPARHRQYYCADLDIKGPFQQHGITTISEWTSNILPCNIRDKITYSFQNFKGNIFVVWEKVSNFIPCFIRDAITYPCWDQILNHVSKGGPRMFFIHHVIAIPSFSLNQLRQYRLIISFIECITMTQKLENPCSTWGIHTMSWRSLCYGRSRDGRWPVSFLLIFICINLNPSANKIITRHSKYGPTLLNHAGIEINPR